ncbi:uncharacterized protein CANTADRAFT_54613 [Suhomyces tanzawaensis NRRL Y-17324]|uniref:Conserved oligomeric Golgi complex subunit 8 n=1 Tax=Suhomyces tanzawaensis NRRL Y-17324 TaxID=984487 RepID=A0A1E4SDZ0_9ASCO|nr:uncharacterized protein CANTADRAFT_54613 [Suhomyces tanzawaensis NRRL Y-17324]ODV77727.1 hypothetical protein CANTADRAFT_54613 [Suhomyces tanzawaensis NRRL Y-17324]
MSDILLDTLVSSLDSDSQKYLENDSQVRQQSEAFLLELLINDDLLSTDIYTTTTTTNTTSKEHKPTLIEVIAELELRQRQINVELASFTNENKDLIIEISSDLNTVDSTIKNDYDHELSAMLNVLEGGLPSKFQVSINEKLTNSIKSSNTILSNIDSVLDFLELPALCKLCILQGNYLESIEISILVQALIIRFPKLVIFQKIHEQVVAELRLMVKGLIKLLNTNLRQNSILKIFQILNKLQGDPSIGFYGSSDENGQKTSSTKDKSNNDKFLKIIYLHARFKFIVNELSNLKPLIKFNKLTYLKRFIEIYREFLFNSLSIYFAIFNPTSSNTHLESPEDKLLVNQFIRNLANILSEEVKRYLPDILSPNDADDEDEFDVQSRKDGLILQITYLCKSLSKYNVDFEAIMVSKLGFGVDSLITEEDWLRNLAKVKKFRQ